MKKLITILLVGALSLSLAACGGKKEEAPVEVPAEAVVDDSTEADAEVEVEVEVDADATDVALDDSADAPVAELPEIDGFEKTEINGMPAYMRADSSNITIMSAPIPAGEAEQLANKDEAYLTQMSEAFSAVMTALSANAEIESKYATVEGKEVAIISGKFPVDEATLPTGGSMTVYVFVNGEDVNTVTGTFLDQEDYSAVLASVVAAV